MKMKPLQSTLDQLDFEIIDRLRRDALTTNKAIAADLGVAESTVGTRIRSLSERNIMRVVAIHDIRALGCDLMAHVDVQVERRDPRVVAAELAEAPEYAMVCNVAGTPQITVQINARDRLDLLQSVLNLNRYKGIVSFNPILSLQILKFVSEFSGNLKKTDPNVIDDPADDILSRILKIVRHDARTGNREIGRMLGVSEALVRKRLKSMIDAGALKFGAMTDPRALGLNCGAFIRLSIEPSQLVAVARHIVDTKDIYFASITCAEFNMLAVATVADREALTELVNVRIGGLRGIRRIDVREISETIKTEFNLVRISPAGLDGLEF